MSFSKPCYPEDRAARYELILAQAVSLLDEALNPIANLANMAALLADALPRINWCGFYLLDGGMLTAEKLRSNDRQRPRRFVRQVPQDNGKLLWKYRETQRNGTVFLRRASGNSGNMRQEAPAHGAFRRARRDPECGSHNGRAGDRRK